MRCVQSLGLDVVARAINRRFPERKFGYFQKGQRQFFWQDGQPYMRVPANRFECHGSAMAIQKILPSHACPPRKHYLIIHTADITAPSSNTHISHYINITSTANGSYVVGATPLDRRVLGMNPFALFNNGLQSTWPASILHPSKEGYERRHRIAFNGYMHPMQWFTIADSEKLAYLFAGFYLDSTSYTFQVAGVSFWTSTPTSFLISLSIERDKFARNSLIPNRFGPQDLKRFPWVKSFTQLEPKRPDLAEVHQASWNLLRDLLIDFRQSLPI
ncbi:MAG: hypothetical protein KKA31_04605 [Candidatus Margulisbacteria bacterium]|nr:hypothetical protein [Candidatus Margulisiibacteriota bacterium]